MKNEKYKSRKSHANLIWQGKSISQDNYPTNNTPSISEQVHFGIKKNSNQLFCGDNKIITSSLLKNGLFNEVKLIYIDPPFGIGNDVHFASDALNNKNKAYEDSWESGLDSYLQMLYERLSIFKNLLSKDGSIYVHLDYHVVHYIKIMMDELFGRENMVNQIIWQRTGAHSDPMAFGRNYDVILFYQKSAKRTWNKSLTDYDDAHLAKYFQQEVSGRWYRLNNPTGKGYQDHLRDFGRGLILPPRDRHWSVSQAQIDQWIKDNRVVHTNKGYPFIKRYLDEMPGKQVQSIWTDLIPPRSSHELTGFPTQKPEKLLERIIKASSNENDLVADFFSGSGTTLVVSEKLKRRWLGCDSNQRAIQIASERLSKIPGVKPFEVVSPIDEQSR
jgi:adenine-specific DNA-methyltransferase